MEIHIWTYTIGKWEYRIDLGSDGRFYIQETNRSIGEFEQTTTSFATEHEAMHWVLNKLSQHYQVEG